MRKSLTPDAVGSCTESDVQSDIFDAAEVELADAPITWRWGRAADMPALRIRHFQSEVAAGEPLYLPEQCPQIKELLLLLKRAVRSSAGRFSKIPLW
jgi:hypothetical protein